MSAESDHFILHEKEKYDATIFIIYQKLQRIKDVDDLKF